ncbi:MAG TPA: DNA recombination protein RmuC [Pseudomonas sp.]|nr:DNA recombination protein RmuC [Pseudomonas sp.]
MFLDVPPALLGSLLVVVALLGLAWHLQRRLAEARSQRMLLEERAHTALLSQDLLNGQLRECREELGELQQHNAAQQAELAAQRRERELLMREQQAWKAERERQETLLRQLVAERAALQAELREQQQAHQQRLADLQAARDTLKAQFAELAGSIFAEREQSSQQRLGQLLEPLKERIQAFEKRVEDSYQQEARERFSLAREVQRLQQLNQRLGEEATNLTRALQGQKNQGSWGELVLERVLEHAGLAKGREYHTQVSLQSPDGQRFQPDVLIQLPGDKQVVVDAKVSLTAYQAMLGAEDEATREASLKRHVQSLRGHLKGLSVKDYQRLEGLHSLDFVLLFVPIEAAFAAALQADPGLFQEAYEQHIVIVSPTTLLATLRVIDSLWRQERQSQNAREIAERAGALYDKFVAFVQDLDEVGMRLQQLDKAYAGARNKLVDGRGNLIGRAENLKLLGARASKSLPAELLEQAAGLPLDEPEEG